MMPSVPIYCLFKYSNNDAVNVDLEAKEWSSATQVVSEKKKNQTVAGVAEGSRSGKSVLLDAEITRDKISLSLRSYSRSEFNHPRMKLHRPD
ncbi:hypothetical protein Bca4012_018926 [Brassica carinata]